jgi:uncharacterized membrane protein YphA (DoxX/SURF4 family)
MKIARILSLLFLALLFLYAGVDKAFHYGGFVKALGGYVLIPDGLERYLALPVILAELLVGAGLLFKPWRSPAALLAAILLSAFTIALAVNQHYAPGVECGCWFTVTLGKASASHVAQNLLLLGLALSVWLDERGGLDPTLGAKSSPNVQEGGTP